MRITLMAALAFLFSVQTILAVPIFTDEFDRTTLPDWTTAVRVDGDGMVSVNGNQLLLADSVSVNSALLNLTGLTGLTYDVSGDSTSIEGGDNIILEYNLGDGSGWQNVFSLNNSSNNAWSQTGAFPVADIVMLRLRNSGTGFNDQYEVERLELDATGGIAGPAATNFIGDAADGTPGSAGWAIFEDVDAGDGDGGGSSSIVSTDDRYIFSRIGPVDRVIGGIEQTVNTTGFENIFVGFSGNVGTGQGADQFSVQYNTGSGWIDLFSGINQSFDVFTQLPIDAENNPNLMFRAQLNANNTETARLEMFTVWGISEGSAEPIPEPTTASVLGLVALAMLRRRKRA